MFWYYLVLLIANAGFLVFNHTIHHGNWYDFTMNMLGITFSVWGIKYYWKKKRYTMSVVSKKVRKATRKQWKTSGSTLSFQAWKAANKETHT